MADFRKWFVAFAVVALLLALGSLARAGPKDRCMKTLRVDICFPNVTEQAGFDTSVRIIVVTEEPVRVVDFTQLSGGFVLLCGVPIDAPGMQIPQCVLMRLVDHDPTFVTGIVQLAELSDGNHVALGTRWQRPLVTLRV
jgi:hypothetical protein